MDDKSFKINGLNVFLSDTEDDIDDLVNNDNLEDGYPKWARWKAKNESC